MISEADGVEAVARPIFRSFEGRGAAAEPLELTLPTPEMHFWSRWREAIGRFGSHTVDS